MIDDLIQILFFVAFLPIGVGWIWGFHCLFSEGYFLNALGDYLESKLPFWITHPLFVCPQCMASVHGSLIFFTFIKLPLIYWPLFCVSICGINFVITKLTEKNELD